PLLPPPRMAAPPVDSSEQLQRWKLGPARPDAIVPPSHPMLNGPSFPPLGPVFYVPGSGGRFPVSVREVSSHSAWSGTNLRMMAPMECSMVMVREFVLAAIMAAALVAGV